MNKLKNLSKRVKVLLIICVLSAGSFLSYSFVDSYFEISKNLDIFTTLYREINTYYVDDTDPGKLMKKGIDAMLESLDPYTNFYPESEIEDYRYMTTGQYGGIGAQIKQKGDYIIIYEPYEGYAAYKAGLMAGDILLEVDGKTLKDKKTEDVSKILKGGAKTIVKLLIKREGEAKPIEKTIEREDIKIKSVAYYGMINNTTGYIKLQGFTENAGNEMKEALVSLKSNPELKSVILDLRFNPGGLLHEAVNIVNLFVDRGQEIVSTKGKVKEWDKTYKALNAAIDMNIPVAVLVNSSSASASEIVSGSIQDLDRGVIIGQRTFGKGLVQTTRPLSYNTQLKVTTAKYYIPSGRCIQALDYSHRNEDGSVGKVADSLAKPFKTKKGRTVYDGGGIIPDVALEPEKPNNITLSLFTKLLIFDYATKYRLKHSTIAPAKDFKLADEDYNDFVAFVSDKDYDYTTKSEKTLEDLKENAQKEKYYEDIKSEYEALRAKMMHNKKEDLLKNKSEIMALLKKEIATRYYYQKGSIEAGFSDDNEIKKAVEVLSNKELYASILDGSFKQK